MASTYLSKIPVSSMQEVAGPHDMSSTRSRLNFSKVPSLHISEIPILFLPTLAHCGRHFFSAHGISDEAPVITSLIGYLTLIKPVIVCQI